MKNLLCKELRLALHPTNLIFPALSAMLLIPNYPYYVVAFYTCLGIFFACMNGRENRDVFYTLLLPVPKKDVVRARFAFVLLLELAQLILMVPFMLIRNNAMPMVNEAGMEANIAFLGICMVLFGVFNLTFLTGYYRDPDKVGVPFVKSCAAVFLLIGAAEGAAHAAPFVRDRLDTKDPAFLLEKLVVFLAGAVIFALLTLAAYRRSAALFEKKDV